MNTANKNATQILKSFFNYGSYNAAKATKTNTFTNSYTESALISNPIYLVSQTFLNGDSSSQGLQITVQLSYYISSDTAAKTLISSNTLKTLTYALTQLYESNLEQPVNVQLEFVRQYQPYMDASILAQYITINASSFGFNRMMNLLLNAVPFLNPQNTSLGRGQINNEVSLGSYITGIKVQLSGLLTSQRNRSRKTVYTASAGTLNNNATTIRCGTTSNGVMSTHIDYGSYTSKSRLGAFTVKV